MTANEVVDSFRDEGWTLVRIGEDCDYGSYLATVSSLSSDQFLIDMHVKDLLVFPPDTHFYNHPFFLEGIILLQDKASCIAPLLLAPSPRSIVLDMCAAPGMKTSYLATMVGKKGKVYAVERDQRRFETLSTLMEKSGATNIKCINRDVMTITDKEIPKTQYILVDPSCSGSGMFDRLQIEDPSAKCNKSRLESLAGFQITILRHALTNFPAVKRVVYSTCSIYSEENEYVVQEVIQSVKNFKLVNLRQQYESKWFHFGSKDFGDLGTKCLYARPETDLTNGFFVAVFERIAEDEINEFFVKRVVTRYDLKKAEPESSIDGENKDNKEDTVNEEINDVSIRKMKKKKVKAINENSVDEENEDIIDDDMNGSSTKIVKKKKKSKIDDTVHEEHETDKKCKKSKKEKKRKLENIIDLNVAENKIEDTVESQVKKKKNIIKNEIENSAVIENEPSNIKCKKLKTNSEQSETSVEDTLSKCSQKSKKKKKKKQDFEEEHTEKKRKKV